MTRQSLNRALQRLQDRGWIAVLRNGVEVRDREALATFAES
ncbi:MAG: helix-turn-helix domain-containing protein [Mycobacteriales bacterium]